MKYFIPLAALFAVFTSTAVAQDVITFQLGVGGDFANTEPLAYSGARAEGEDFILTVIEDWLPQAQDQATRGTPDGISVAICGQEFPPFQPNATMATGEVIIPLGNTSIADAAARLMTGEIDCTEFAATRAAAAGDITSLLPPQPAPVPGLMIVSPSDSYHLYIGDVITSDVIYNPASGRHDLHLGFFPTLTIWLANTTTAHIGEQIELVLCGQVLNAPTVQAPITSGSIVIAGPVDKTEAELELERILGTQPCP